MTRAETKPNANPENEGEPGATGPKAEARAGESELAAQLAAAKAEAAQSNDRFLRAVADLENYRRRAIREKDELRISAGARIVEDVLPVLDNLALGLNAARQPNADVKTLVGGVEMVLQQLKTALSNHGLVEINPPGKPFNPHEHEAISHEPSATVPAEHVLTVVRTGFTLNGRLLRPAAVVVSSGPKS
jgi:molecular chaperone GrpE